MLGPVSVFVMRVCIVCFFVHVFMCVCLFVCLCTSVRVYDNNCTCSLCRFGWSVDE